jgi:hypothetical protein
MTFSIIVPNANQSPGLFPTQNNTNFQRIKDIVNNDHNWTDSTSASQGIHKQCTFINRTTPVGLPAGNGVLYSQADTTGASQLRWYNGASDVQITNSGEILIGSGSAALTTTSTNIFTVPDNSFGYMYLWRAGSLFTGAYILWQSAGYAIMQMTATYLGSSASSSGAIIPIIFDNSIITQSLNLLAKTSSSSFNGTYQYRIFKVA